MRTFCRRVSFHFAVIVDAGSIVSVVLATIVLLASGDLLAGISTDDERVLKGSEAFGDWRKDRPGVKRLLTPQDLPPISQSTSTWVEIVPRPDGKLRAAGLLSRLLDHH
jgi:hypothetical protein